MSRASRPVCSVEGSVRIGRVEDPALLVHAERQGGLHRDAEHGLHDEALVALVDGKVGVVHGDDAARLQVPVALGARDIHARHDSRPGMG